MEVRAESHFFHKRSIRCLSTSPDKTLENALKGDLDSIAEVGRQYLDKERKDEDGISQARIWLELAAELDHIESAFLLGVYLTKTAQTPVEEEVATVTDTSSPESRAKLVLKEIQAATQTARTERKMKLLKKKNKQIEENGEKMEEIIVLSDNDLGLDWLRKVSRKNHGKAMCYLGNLLFATGNVGDVNEAMLWYEKASKLSPPQTDALFNLGTILFDGKEGMIQQDVQKSFEYFKLGADLGDLSSQFWVGYCYFSGEGFGISEDTNHGTTDIPINNINPRLALKYLKLAAEKGHSSALYYLAILYRSGLSGCQNIDGESDISPDKELFLKYLLLAVEAEDPDALYCYGDLYMNTNDGSEFEHFIPKNEKKGRELYEKASALGHLEATVCLGALHYHGIAGIERNPRKAFELYNLAAEGGSLEAWRNLAAMYFTGDGIPKSEETAKEIMRVMFNNDKKDD
eukprot:CAMPEP_0119034290 /NCGR_PEP_ID=MMETSP1177-20130426/1287_1 /TAXON_ID=2985 /ORGANISM="Ochromonas sp, Strain CCMP1899" /LENGTH=459 /DNA_ID=CAMNT_0006991617 /DNA_START=159 /DNA_END=1539 /DNA_ORIENTATION=-